MRRWDGWIFNCNVGMLFVEVQYSKTGNVKFFNKCIPRFNISGGVCPQMFNACSFTLKRKKPSPLKGRKKTP